MSYTDNISLTIRAAEDAVDYQAFNRDNQIIDGLLGPVQESYASTSRAAVMNGYNLYRLMSSSGSGVYGARGIFYGSFTSSTPAAGTSTGVEANPQGGYYFAPTASAGPELGSSGSVATSVGYLGTWSDNTHYSFSVTSGVYGILYGMEVTAALSGSQSCELKAYLRADSASCGNDLSFGTPTSTAATMTLSIAERVITPSTVLSGYIGTSGSNDRCSLYGAAASAPHIKFLIRPIASTGWVKTALTDLRWDGFREARAYVQVSTSQNVTVSAAMVNSGGTETALTLKETRDGYTHSGTACRELCFAGATTGSSLALKISVTAQTGVTLTGYGVVMM